MTVLPLVKQLLLFALVQVHFDDDYGDYWCMGLGPAGLGWVVGPEVYLAVGWVVLGQLFGGLGWV